MKKESFNLFYGLLQEPSAVRAKVSAATGVAILCQRLPTNSARKKENATEKLSAVVTWPNVLLLPTTPMGPNATETLR